VELKGEGYHGVAFGLLDCYFVVIIMHTCLNLFHLQVAV